MNAISSWQAVLADLGKGTIAPSPERTPPGGKEVFFTPAAAAQQGTPVEAWHSILTTLKGNTQAANSRHAGCSPGSNSGSPRARGAGAHGSPGSSPGMVRQLFASAERGPKQGHCSSGSNSSSPAQHTSLKQLQGHAHCAQQSPAAAASDAVKQLFPNSPDRAAAARRLGLASPAGLRSGKHCRASSSTANHAGSPMAAAAAASCRRPGTASVAVQDTQQLADKLSNLRASAESILQAVSQAAGSPVQQLQLPYTHTYTTADFQTSSKAAAFVQTSSPVRSNHARSSPTPSSSKDASSTEQQYWQSLRAGGRLFGSPVRLTASGPNDAGDGYASPLKGALQPATVSSSCPERHHPLPLQQQQQPLQQQITGALSKVEALLAAMSAQHLPNRDHNSCREGGGSLCSSRLLASANTGNDGGAAAAGSTQQQQGQQQEVLQQLLLQQHQLLQQLLPLIPASGKPVVTQVAAEVAAAKPAAIPDAVERLHCHPQPRSIKSSCGSRDLGDVRRSNSSNDVRAPAADAASASRGARADSTPAKTATESGVLDVANQTAAAPHAAVEAGGCAAVGGFAAAQTVRQAGTAPAVNAGWSEATPSTAADAGVAEAAGPGVVYGAAADPNSTAAAAGVAGQQEHEPGTPAASLPRVHTPGRPAAEVAADTSTPLLAHSTAAVLTVSQAWREEASSTQDRWRQLLEQWSAEEVDTCTPQRLAEPPGAGQQDTVNNMAGPSQEQQQQPAAESAATESQLPVEQQHEPECRPRSSSSSVSASAGGKGPCQQQTGLQQEREHEGNRPLQRNLEVGAPAAAAVAEAAGASCPQTQSSSACLPQPQQQPQQEEEQELQQQQTQPLAASLMTAGEGQDASFAGCMPEVQAQASGRSNVVSDSAEDTQRATCSAPHAQPQAAGAAQAKQQLSQQQPQRQQVLGQHQQGLERLGKLLQDLKGLQQQVQQMQTPGAASKAVSSSSSFKLPTAAGMPAGSTLCAAAAGAPVGAMRVPAVTGGAGSSSASSDTQDCAAPTAAASAGASSGGGRSVHKMHTTSATAAAAAEAAVALTTASLNSSSAQQTPGQVLSGRLSEAINRSSSAAAGIALLKQRLQDSRAALQVISTPMLTQDLAAVAGVTAASEPPTVAAPAAAGAGAAPVAAAAPGGSAAVLPVSAWLSAGPLQRYLNSRGSAAAAGTASTHCGAAAAPAGAYGIVPTAATPVVRTAAAGKGDGGCSSGRAAAGSQGGSAAASAHVAALVDKWRAAAAANARGAPLSGVVASSAQKAGLVYQEPLQLQGQQHSGSKLPAALSPLQGIAAASTTSSCVAHGAGQPAATSSSWTDRAVGLGSPFTPVPDGAVSSAAAGSAGSTRRGRAPASGSRTAAAAVSLVTSGPVSSVEQLRARLADTPPAAGTRLMHRGAASTGQYSSSSSAGASSLQKLLAMHGSSGGSSRGRTVGRNATPPPTTHNLAKWLQQGSPTRQLREQLQATAQAAQQQQQERQQQLAGLQVTPTSAALLKHCAAVDRTLLGLRSATPQTARSSGRPQTSPATSAAAGVAGVKAAPRRTAASAASGSGSSTTSTSSKSRQRRC